MSVLAKGVSFVVPPLSSSVAVGALVGWMLVLTFKHIVADFFLQNTWMALGKDQKTRWALPLLAHCLVHLAVSMLLILIIAPSSGSSPLSILRSTSLSIVQRAFASPPST